MFIIQNQKDLFDLILLNTKSKDLDDISQQLQPFTIDWDALDRHYLDEIKKNKSDICDCDFQRLARLHESQKTNFLLKWLRYFNLCQLGTVVITIMLEKI